jgi:hypothetical protein
MKTAVTTFMVAMAVASPALSQRVAVVRGVGTQTCTMFVESERADKQFTLQATQWILGTMTGYFRQAADDPSRTLGDAVLVQTVAEICKKNGEKTIDEATTIAIRSLPNTEVKKPGEIK